MYTTLEKLCVSNMKLWHCLLVWRSTQLYASFDFTPFKNERMKVVPAMRPCRQHPLQPSRGKNMEFARRTELSFILENKNTRFFGAVAGKLLAGKQ